MKKLSCILWAIKRWRLADVLPLSPLPLEPPQAVLRERRQGHTSAGAVRRARGGTLHPRPAAELEREPLPATGGAGLPAAQ